MMSTTQPTANRSIVSGSVKRRLWHIARSVLGLTILGLITTKSFVAYLTTVDAQTASSLPFSSATARLILADRAIHANQKGSKLDLSEQTRAQIRAWTTAALKSEPLNAHGLEILGLLEADNKEATKWMSAAANRSLRTPIALYWMLQKELAARNYAATGRYADALLRIKPQAMPFVVAKLEKMAETAAAEGTVEQLFMQDPPWRSAFFTYLKGHIRDARAPFKLLVALNGTAHPASAQEIDAYLRILIENKLYDLAYYSWLQLLPPQKLSRAGLLFDGDFEFSPSDPPYDWVIQSAGGVNIEIAPRDDRPPEHALSIQFGAGRIDFPAVSQLLALKPGRYVFSGLFKGEINGPRGLRWRVECLGTNARQAETKMLLGTAPRWVKFTTDFEVPSGCPAQTLKLILDARSTSETLVSGEAWFDELAITRN